MGRKGCLFLVAVVAVVSADGEQPGRPPGMLPGGRRKSTPIWHPTPEPLPVSVNGSEWRELDWQEGQAVALGGAVECSPMLCRPPGRLPGMLPGGRRKGAPRRLNAFMAAIVIVRSTRSFGAKAALVAA